MATTNSRYETASPPTENRATDYYRLRSNRQRRATIEVLSERRGRLSIDELATAVAERTPTEITTDRAKIRLHHVDLPLLVEAGIAEYEREDGTVRVVEPVADLLV